MVDVLAVFLTHPDSEFYQTNIVKSTGCALTGSKRTQAFGRYRIDRESQIRQSLLFYKANQKHPAFQDVKNALFKNCTVWRLAKG